MNQTVNIKDFEKEEKRRIKKENRKHKFDNAVYWCEDHKELLALTIPVVCTVIGGTCKLGASINRKHAVRKEQYLKERYIYDRTLGMYLELRKPLSKSQMKTILERKDNGERLTTILQQMNLLK